MATGQPARAPFQRTVGTFDEAGASGHETATTPKSGMILVDTETVELRRGAGPTVVHDVARLTQIDVAGEKVQLLFVAPDHQLEALRLVCRDQDDARHVVDAVVDRCERRTGQRFPSTWIQDHPEGWFAPG